MAEALHSYPEVLSLEGRFKGVHFSCHFLPAKYQYAGCEVYVSISHVDTRCRVTGRTRTVTSPYPFYRFIRPAEAAVADDFNI